MKATPTPRARLALEGLEDRYTPATLDILGTAAADTVVVSMQAGLIKVVNNGAVSFHNPAVFTDIRFRGFAGNDKFFNNTAIKSVAYGMSGDDLLVGGFNNDCLFGGDGVDRLYGRNGNDCLFGGAGRDFLYGGNGNDYLHGGIDGAKDTLFGGMGRDRFKKEMVGVINQDAPSDFVAADDLLV